MFITFKYREIVYTLFYTPYRYPLFKFKVKCRLIVRLYSRLRIVLRAASGERNLFFEKYFKYLVSFPC